MDLCTARPLSYPQAVLVRPPLDPRLLALVKDYGKREESWGGRFVMATSAPEADAIRLDGNDYLCLTGHPAIVNAQVASLKASLRDGDSAPPSVIQSTALVGEGHPSRRLEQALARYVGKDDVHLLQSGYIANVALLQFLCHTKPPVYVDSQAHMSLWEGVNAARATPTMFRHNDVEHLRRVMERNGPGVVLVDSVYSGVGSRCPLAEVADLCEATGSTLVVDESHSLGLFGEQGAGLVAELGLTDRVHFITASLAKAFAARAGFFTAPACLREYIYSLSFPSVFSSCMLPHEVAGLAATLDVLKGADAARARLHANAARIRQMLADRGFPVAHSTEQIITLVVGTEPQAMQLRDAFEVRGIFAALFCAPATATNRAMLRMTVHSDLTESDMQRIEAAATAVARELRPWEWASARRQGLVFVPPAD